MDFLWKAGSAVDDLWDGTWGLLRAYQNQQQDLWPLSTNPPGSSPPFGIGNFNGVCPTNAPVRSYDIAAVASWEALPGGTLTYNSRTTPLDDCQLINGVVSCTPSGKNGPLHDPTAMIFAHTSDLVAVGIGSGGRTIYNLRPGVPIEPLVLRANSGDCIQVTLHNYLPPEPKDLPGYSLMPNVVDRFNINQVVPSMEVGLHAQLVSYDVTRADGLNVGQNLPQTVAPNGFKTFQWYAGQIVYDRVNNVFTPVPTEFGSANLTSADPLKHSNKALVGALVIEPTGSTWTVDSALSTCGLPGEPRCSRASATVNPGTPGEFREAVVLFQTDVNLRYEDNSPVYNTFLKEDPAESGQSAINYRTEPVWFRKRILPQTKPQVTRKIDMADAFANGLIGGLDPETPVYQAVAHTATRMRVLLPGGHAQQVGFGLHGHVWQEEPYVANSTVLGNNTLSEWHGAQHGHGPTNHFDALLQHGAGSAFGITGDYLMRDYAPWRLFDGAWGLFRVVP